jgi:hypothetical protein
MVGMLVGAAVELGAGELNFAGGFFGAGLGVEFGLPLGGVV